MKPSMLSTVCAVLLAVPAYGQVPTDVQQPGTQPLERDPLFDFANCASCHSGYDPAVEPAFGWQGSLMSHATRDPLSWAAIAVADQDFPGAGDLCLRCHTPAGWLAGRSTPTDGSGLLPNQDGEGVTCHVCHSMTNPDGSEPTLLGIQNAPFVANSGGSNPEGYYGGAMYVLWAGKERLGPYADAVAKHGFFQSTFQRSSAHCGTCHDVSNPVVGDLAPGHGAFTPLAPGTYSGTPGTPVDGKAAFNNPPYRYGVVERTYSEHVASGFPTLLVSDYATLPPELQAGSIADAHQAAMASTPDGNYVDGTPRTFTCQTCHMRPATGMGAKQGSTPVRTDLPLHDLTGGNYWMPQAIQWLDAQGRLLAGGGLTLEARTAMDAAAQRARTNLQRAASLEVLGDTVRVVNLTGHKLISGYPEGRRMWLNVQWFDAQQALLREDGAYGLLAVSIPGMPAQVETLLDPHGTNTRVYEAHFGLSQEWAAKLIGLGVSGSLPLAYDRTTGQVTETLGDVAALPPGSAVETFHFALNDTLLSDLRIPPYAMDRDEAFARNIQPVPADAYGDPAPGGVYQHWDDVALQPPSGAASATIELLYQPTSWEYLLFLNLANTGASTFLASAGDDLLDAWLATGMAGPHLMAATTWTAPPCTGDVSTYCTAKAGLACGTPAMSSAGTPSASATSGFFVSAAPARSGRTGILLYTSTGRAAVPFSGGLLCLQTPPLRRGGPVQSGGTSGPNCDGAFALDLNAFASGNYAPGFPTHNPAPFLLVPGQQVNCQWWGRDTPATGSFLSDALEYTVCP